MHQSHSNLHTLKNNMGKNAHKNPRESSPYGPQWTVAKDEAHNISTDNCQMQESHSNLRTLKSDLNEN